MAEPKVTRPKPPRGNRNQQTNDLDVIAAQIAADYKKGKFTELPAGITIADVQAKMRELYPDIRQGNEPLPSDLTTEDISVVIAKSGVMPGKGRENGTLYFFIPCEVDYADAEGVEKTHPNIRILCPSNFTTVNAGDDLTDAITATPGTYQGRDIVNLTLSAA